MKCSQDDKISIASFKKSRGATQKAREKLLNKSLTKQPNFLIKSN